MEQNNYSPIETAVALSLYLFNISPILIAKKIYDQFDGNCMDFEDLVEHFGDRSSRKAYLATELPMPTALVLVSHALERYGEEARERVRINLEELPGPVGDVISGMWNQSS